MVLLESLISRHLVSAFGRGLACITGALLCLGWVGSAAADPADAVVRIHSHGCTGTVIATGPGESWILTCAHAFEGRDASKPLAIDAPAPIEGHEQQQGTGVCVVKIDHAADLCLIRLPRGPLPFFAPVGTVEPRPGDVLTAVGHASMRWPQNAARVQVRDLEGNWTHTVQRPRPGDSGGPLLDSTGALVGTCTGFESGAAGRGMYVRLGLIRLFLGLIRGSERSLPRTPPALRGGRPGFG